MNNNTNKSLFTVKACHTTINRVSINFPIMAQITVRFILE